MQKKLSDNSKEKKYKMQRKQLRDTLLVLKMQIKRFQDGS
jgi:hypothetical protein